MDSLQLRLAMGSFTRVAQAGAVAAVFGVLLFGSHVALAAEAGSRLSSAIAVDVRYDDNIGLAPDSPSHRDDISTRVGATLAWQLIQQAQTEVALSATPFYQGVADLADLSNYGIEIGGNFRRQFSPDFFAPYISGSAVGMWREYEDSEPRDGYQVDFELAVGKQFTTRLAGELGFRAHHRRSTDRNPEGAIARLGPGGTLIDSSNADEVFDLDRRGGFIKLDYVPAPKTTIFIEYNYMTGDVAATGDALGFNNPEAFDSVRDFAFEEGVQFLAWRIDADQDIFTLGWNQDVTDKLSAALTVRYLDASGEFDNNYENLVVNLNLKWNF